jgi:conflict system STAND superfamily ATPase
MRSRSPRRWPSIRKRCSRGVFTACAGEAERRAFIQALCATPANGEAQRLHVILGLHADFYGRCLGYPELVPMVAAGQLPVRPMTRDDLCSAVEGPAGAVGLGFVGDLLIGLPAAEQADAGKALDAYAGARRSRNAARNPKRPAPPTAR